MSVAQLRLSTTVRFRLKMTISTICLSTFSDLTFSMANVFAKPQDLHPVAYTFYFFQLLEFCALHQEYFSTQTLDPDGY